MFTIKYSEAEYFVRIKIERNRELRTLKEKVLNKFNHTVFQLQYLLVMLLMFFKFIKIIDTNKKNVELFSYKEAIGLLMFLTMITRSDLTFIVNVLNQFAEKPRNYWNGVNELNLIKFKYLKEVINYDLIYDQTSKDSILTLNYILKL